METEKPKDRNPSTKELEHTVTIGGKPEKVSLEPGARLSDLLKKFLKTHPGLNLAGHSILLNSRLINHHEGELKENPILVQPSTVTIAPRLSGG
ncbi:MAG: hypothetical protein A3B99_03140 [Candidatus Yanofskybacteria bacterium RIFCSPHIGHO2_02_FULL_44_12b]|uniref:MoaD/ThiS family protein n=2 Tax=Candidatus Yanofskyibacteriota TaxID=1752733 RepID=A0A1F8GM92_9BACT|nr:MAG: hypothetical protein UW79_C0005G0014 [Candidatus Yanofskybacteria bacterium GW2011_GWA2_44_9]OGN05516.1 MAG: hypothetical protein A2659_02915 [Candidatus Yanofskybacteria bacterium RIFCSPHIGHO2_01_FULL_44_24]OGN15067.1 MAG: hypothetical protein A3B99_03140 [Candidatus Yanofskybacteria bacterium RIFCSPHIGHO2_02_FULL_44_12b]OGN26535.1 MAG: hypothetical protein A2925_03280 [Candidatus Yanofskybacteria bacterium RIFCSPLOWO2_01_FULL_44_22]